MAELHFRSAAISNVGKVRRVNEDAFFNHAEHQLWAVADGMGGHDAGDVASTQIVSALKSLVSQLSADSTQPSNDFENYVSQVEHAILKANEQLQILSARKEGTKVMGSTVVALLVQDSRAACIWAGDSRLYRYRAGQLEKLSKDHSLVQLMVDAGDISEEEAQVHPQSNVITRAVGVDENLVLDLKLFELQSGDKLLLCSDGVYGEIDDSVLMSALSQDVQGACAEIETQVMQQKARDNLTAVVVEVV